MAEAWDDESFFKHGLEAGHGVDLQTSSTRFFSTTNGVCRRRTASFLNAAAVVRFLPWHQWLWGVAFLHSAHGDPLSLVQDGAHAEVLVTS